MLTLAASPLQVVLQPDNAESAVALGPARATGLLLGFGTATITAELVGIMVGPEGPPGLDTVPPDITINVTTTPPGTPPTVTRSGSAASPTFLIALPAPSLTELSFAFPLPLMVWTIRHNLDRYPGVNLVDTTGETIYGDVSYADSNSLSVAWGAPTAGTAYIA